MTELRAVTSKKIYSLKKVGEFNYIKWYDNYKILIAEFKLKYADKIKKGMTFEEKVIMQEELLTKSFEGHNVNFTIQQ